MQTIKGPGAVARIMDHLEKMPAGECSLISVTKLEGDEFLYLVLVEQKNKSLPSGTVQWVTWWWNDQAGGFSTGHYHQYLHHAFDDYIERLRTGCSWELRNSLGKAKVKS